MDNIHDYMVKPDKFHRSTKLSIPGDIVLFTFSDSGYSKSELVWKLGRVEEVSQRKIIVQYVDKVNTSPPHTMSSLSRSPRNVSIVFLVSELFINTNDPFSSLFIE